MHTSHPEYLSISTNITIRYTFPTCSPKNTALLFLPPVSDLSDDQETNSDPNLVANQPIAQACAGSLINWATWTPAATCLDPHPPSPVKEPMIIPKHHVYFPPLTRRSRKIKEAKNSQDLLLKDQHRFLDALKTQEQSLVNCKLWRLHTTTICRGCCFLTRHTRITTHIPSSW
ncbi:hypothetical protein PCASD_05773 [Puccinia coronata f. sp. avenae]|uniref:Uncharacterized protein n=1 Tax=Puccinia coronata f. sp. avenae TaxID=200324 RepID=A0A2N5V1G4_9BASI|nr:hypothetical protein PCASD_05773 [Puccinia coronata f. sp. avenae]